MWFNCRSICLELCRLWKFDDKLTVECKSALPFTCGANHGFIKCSHPQWIRLASFIIISGSRAWRWRARGVHTDRGTLIIENIQDIIDQLMMQIMYFEDLCSGALDKPNLIYFRLDRQKFISMFPTSQVNETSELKVPLRSKLQSWQTHSAYRGKQLYLGLSERDSRNHTRTF